MPLRYFPNSSLHIVLLFVLCTLPYSETIHHDWHLDDPPNILHNNLLHISDLHPATLAKTFHAHPTNPGKLFRPVANLSFGLNWFFDQDQPYGYHLVNIAIHWLTTVALYLTCFLLLLQSPALKTRNLKYQSSIALLAASLWALAPIQAQAVTYIVQRMAQLATFFSITAILFFLLARLATDKTKRFIFSICFLCSLLLALGSKENSILLPVSILLVEFIFFFQGESIPATIQKNKKKSLTLLLVSLTGCSLIIWHYGSGMFNYEHRSFTMLERALTEPRILLFYLSQIFLPSASKLSIEHDIVLSTSLFSPWNTLPAIVACMGLIIFSLFRIRKNPLLSFAILFFFINHLVESTIIPLELLFEHRNYLPSLFLFLPFAAFLTTSISKKTFRDRWIKPLLATVCTGFLILSGTSTYERNKAWASEQTLWQDAVAKAPDSGRAKLNLAKNYIKEKKYEEAFQLCEESEQFTGTTRNKLVPISLNSKGAIAYRQGNYDEALALFTKALALRNDYTEVSYKIIQLLIELKRYNEALDIVTERYNKTEDTQLLLIKGSLLLRLNNPAESLKTYHTARHFFPTSALIHAGQGKAMSMLGLYEQADIILRFAMTVREPGASFLCIENYLRWGRHDQATELLQQLIKSVPLHILLDEVEASSKGAFQVPFDNLLIKKKLFAILDKDLHTSLQDNKSESNSLPF